LVLQYGKRLIGGCWSQPLRIEIGEKLKIISSQSCWRGIFKLLVGFFTIMNAVKRKIFDFSEKSFVNT
jgi:hypothetical protein